MDFLKESQDLFQYTQGLRRDFHQNPETAFEEHRSAAIVAEELSKLGISVQTGIGKTGVVGILKGSQPGPVLLLRSDMDALPIIEENKVPYISKVPGKMHACGHDAHMAVVLTAAKMLASKKDLIKGTVKFVFQPAEEIGDGALAMIADGVLEDLKPDYSLGMHVWNEKPVGWFGISKGPVMAGADIFKVTIIGKGGHGANPHLANDPIIATAHVITALQSIVSRNVSPRDTAVVSVTMLYGGTAFNIIPPSITFEGTIRTFLPIIHEKVVGRFNEIVNNVSNAFGCRAEINLTQSTLPVINDPALAEKLSGLAENLIPNAIIDKTFQTMGSEDMAYFMTGIPGCFVMVGSANEEKGLDFQHHHPRFDIDESCLPLAAALLTVGAISILEGSKVE